MQKEKQDKSEEIEFYDRWSESNTYVEYGHFTPFGHNSIIRTFNKFVGQRLSRGHKVIDLGCGGGAFTRRFFRDAASECFGLDISFGLIQAASGYSSNVRFLVGDMENLCLKNDCFDLVVFSGVLHHFPNITAILREAYRILKKGGCVLSYDPNIRNPFMWLYRNPASPFCAKGNKTDNERLLPSGEVVGAMEISGLKNVCAKSIGGVTFKYVESRLGRFLLPCYNLFEAAFGMSCLASKFGSFMIYYGEKS